MSQRISDQLVGNAVTLLGVALFIILITQTALTVNAQNTPAPDKETDRVQAMISQAKNEADQFLKSGGKPGDASNPNVKWAAELWQYREKHPGTPATVTATVEALRLLNRADRLSEVREKTDTLKPDEAASEAGLLCADECRFEEQRLQLSNQQSRSPGPVCARQGHQSAGPL